MEIWANPAAAGNACADVHAEMGHHLLACNLQNRSNIPGPTCFQMYHTSNCFHV
jgi:hypothetical protein